MTTAYLGTVTFHRDVARQWHVRDLVPAPLATRTAFSTALVMTSVEPTFNSAWLINVPEPGALSLLVMGVGGMLLAGRGRRS